MLLLSPSRRLIAAGQRAPPPGLAHPHSHTHSHTHTRARSHTRTPSLLFLFISSSCLGTQEERGTAPAPRSLRPPRPAPPWPPPATLRKRRPGRFQNGVLARVSSSLPSRARQRPLPAPPTDPRRREGLIPPPANRLCGWLPSWPIGERESPMAPRGLLGVVVFSVQERPQSGAHLHPPQLPLVTRTHLPLTTTTPTSTGKMPQGASVIIFPDTHFSFALTDWRVS